VPPRACAQACCAHAPEGRLAQVLLLARLAVCVLHQQALQLLRQAAALSAPVVRRSRRVFPPECLLTLWLQAAHSQGAPVRAQAQSQPRALPLSRWLPRPHLARQPRAPARRPAQLAMALHAPPLRWAHPAPRAAPRPRPARLLAPRCRRAPRLAPRRCRAPRGSACSHSAG
jgi:hypothetical protein